MKSKLKQPVLIFGYGSLISKESLYATVKNAKNAQPALIKGFRREFSKWDSEGFHSSNLDLAGIPYCAVDVITDTKNVVNGVVFEVDETDLGALKHRETGYAIIETPAYCFKTGKPLGGCFVFSSNACNGKYENGNPAQERYLKICLEGAKEYGDDFYKQFLATTYIGNKSLDIGYKLTV